MMMQDLWSHCAVTAKVHCSKHWAKKQKQKQNKIKCELHEKMVIRVAFNKAATLYHDYVE